MAEHDKYAMAAVVSETPVSPTLEAELPPTAVETPHGTVQAILQGDLKKPVIITYHDIGLDYKSCFQGMFGHPDFQKILTHMCIIHITAPGQERGAAARDGSAAYPTMDELASHVGLVADHFGVHRFIGIGAGAGGEILTRYALQEKFRVRGLVLIGTHVSRIGWLEWGSFKFNAHQLHSTGNMTNWAVEGLLTRYFSPLTWARSLDLMGAFRTFLSTRNATNLAAFMYSYATRDDISTKITHEFSPRVLMLYGSHYAYKDEILNHLMNFNPERTSQMEIWGTGGLVHEERPDAVSKPLKLFINGCGTYLDFE